MKKRYFALLFLVLLLFLCYLRGGKDEAILESACSDEKIYVKWVKIKGIYCTLFSLEPISEDLSKVKGIYSEWVSDICLSVNVYWVTDDGICFESTGTPKLHYLNTSDSLFPRLYIKEVESDAFLPSYLGRKENEGCMTPISDCDNQIVARNIWE